MKPLYEFLVKKHITTQQHYEIAEIQRRFGNVYREYILITADNKDEFIQDVECNKLNGIDAKQLIETINEFFDDLPDNGEDCLCISPRYSAKGFSFTFRNYNNIKLNIIDTISINDFTIDYWKKNNWKL